MKSVLIGVAAALAGFVNVPEARACDCLGGGIGGRSDQVIPTVLPTASLWLQLNVPDNRMATVEIRLVASQTKKVIDATVARYVRTDRITAQISPTLPLVEDMTVEVEVRENAPGLPVAPWSVARKYKVGSRFDVTLLHWPRLEIRSAQLRIQQFWKRDESPLCKPPVSTWSTCGVEGPSLVVEALARHTDAMLIYVDRLPEGPPDSMEIFPEHAASVTIFSGSPACGSRALEPADMARALWLVPIDINGRRGKAVYVPPAAYTPEPNCWAPDPQ